MNNTQIIRQIDRQKGMLDKQVEQIIGLEEKEMLDALLGNLDELIGKNITALERKL